MNSNTKKKTVIVLAIACAFLSFAYFIPSHAQPGTGLPGDETCRKLLAEKENREALSWLQESKPGNIRTIGEQSPEDSLSIVQSLYNSGAVKVHAVKIEGRNNVAVIDCIRRENYNDGP